MPDIQQKFNDILLIISSETDAPLLLERAAELAQENQALLTVMQVVSAPSAEKRREVEGLSQRQDDLVAPLRKRIEVDVILREGSPALEIVHDVLRGERDLVVKAVESNVGFQRRLFGNTDIQLLRKFPCPVWFVRTPQLKPYRRIMAAVKVDLPGVDQPLNGHALNRHILQLGFSLAMIEPAEFHVVHVWQVYREDILRSGRLPFPQRDTDAYVEWERKRHLQKLQELLAEVRSSIASKMTMSGSTTIWSKVTHESR